MLAITHHVIVRSCSIRLGKLNFKDYCVLGDDIVIADDEVSQEYLSVMRNLGLEVNRQKSVESKRFTEFAKRLKGPSVELSPIGAGLILQTLRSKSYRVKFAMEIIFKGLVTLEGLAQWLDESPK